MPATDGLRALVEAIEDRIEAGQLVRMNSIVIDRDFNDGGVYHNQQLGTFGFASQVQNFRILGVEKVDASGLQPAQPLHQTTTVQLKK